MKKCKGIGKAKGVKGCGQITFKRTFGLCPSCLFEWATTNDNGKVWYKSQFLPKVAKNTLKHRKTQNKSKRESLKSIARLIQEARVPFQRWIRFRDANKPCAACGTTEMNIVHASHIWKAEIYTGLIFDEMNVHSCCNKCNIFLNGNEVAFRQGIAERYGSDYVIELDKKSNRLRNYKFTREELKQIKEKYQKLLKHESNNN